MNYFNNFIIVDDYKINNTLCRKIIEKIYPDADIQDFEDPHEGFNHIVEKYSKPGFEGNAILLLDIMMPVMNAWGFLEKFEQLDESVKKRIKIYILSSSVDKNDMARAQSNKHVEYYLIKPLTKDSIRIIVHVLHKRLGLPLK